MRSEIYNLFSVFALLITIIVSMVSIKTVKETSGQTYNEKIASIYERFSTGPVLKAREDVWYKILPRYFKDVAYYRSTIYYEFDNPSDQSLTKEELGEIDIELHNDRAMIGNLIDFYCYIYRLFKNDHENLKEACNQYFYHWWRGFLLSYALSSKSKWIELFKSNEAQLRIPFHINLSIILKIDRMVMDQPYNPDDDIVLTKFPNRNYCFPGLDDHNTHWPK